MKMKEAKIHVSVNRVLFRHIMPAINVLLIDAFWIKEFLLKVDFELRQKGYKGVFLIHFVIRDFADVRRYFVLNIFDSFTNFDWVNVQNWEIKNIIQSWRA